MLHAKKTYTTMGSSIGCANIGTSSGTGAAAIGRYGRKLICLIKRWRIHRTTSAATRAAVNPRTIVKSKETINPWSRSGSAARIALAMNGQLGKLLPRSLTQFGKLQFQGLMKASPIILPRMDITTKYTAIPPTPPLDWLLVHPRSTAAQSRQTIRKLAIAPMKT